MDKIETFQKGPFWFDASTQSDFQILLTAPISSRGLGVFESETKF